MKSKRLLILLLMALLVPWAAMAQTTSVFSDGFEDMTSAEYLTTNGYFTYSDARCNFTFTTDYHGSGEGNTKALYADSWDGSSGCTQILGLPILANQINGLQIAFTYFASSSSITLGYLTADDKSTFVNLQTYSSNSSMTSVGPYDLSAVPETATRIALKFNSYWNFYVDDINVSLLPTCPKPTLSSTVATTNTTATVSWTPSGDNQQLFDLYWSTSSTAPTAATTPSVANYEGTSYVFNFADLNPSSTYYVWVRGNCGTATDPDVSGGWTTSSVSFETPCDAISTLPWTVDFENMTANTVPQCWDNSASTSSTLSSNPERIWGVYSYGSGQNANKMLRMYNYYVQDGTALINTPQITLPANSEYLLYFDYSHRADCGAFKVKISENGGTTFVEKGTYTATSTSYSYTDPGTFTAATPIDLSSYAGKTIIVQFFATANYSSGAIFVDNFRIDLPMPTITSVESTSPLSTTVTWTGASSATGYVYQYKLQDATEWGQEHAVGNSVLSADITTVADGQYDFRLKAQYGTNYSSWVTTQFTAPGYCMVPSGLVITNVTWSQAELSWTEEFGDGEWTLLYKPAGEEGYTNYGTVTTADMPVTLGSLIADTTYNVKIYPTCDEAKFITDQFTTKCEPITEPSWEENFESYDATTSNYSSGHSYDLTASCWKNEHISGAGTYLFQISSYSSTTGNTTKKLVLPDMTSGTMTKLVLPGFEIPSGTNYQFSLDVYRNSSTSNYGEGIRVFASTDGEIEGATELAFISRSYATAYTIGGNIIIPAESASGWYSYELPIGFDGVCYIILRGESLFGSSTYMDNFAIEPVPTCHRPMNLAYTPASLTNHSVTLTWTAPEGQTAWQIAYSTTEFNPNNAGFDLSTVSTQNVTGENPTYHFDKTLEADATYYMYVRSNCGTAEAPDYSKWSREGCRFHTKIVKPYPTSLVASEKLPTSLKLGWTIGGGDYETAWDIYYSTSSEDVPTDETEPTIAGVTDNPNLIEGLAANTYYYFYVRSVHSDAGASAWSSALYTNTPEACPKPSSLTVAEPTPNSLKLSWTAGAAWQTAWTIAYSTTTGFDPTDGTACTYVDAPTNPFVVEGLDSEQTYYFRVKGACDEYDATSAWNQYQATGTTLVNCPIPTTANATNLTPHTATLNWTGYSEKYNVRYRTPEYENPSFSEDFEKGIPATWTCIANGTTPTVAPNGWTTTTYSGSTVAVSFSWTSSEGDFDADNWLITPLINLQDTLKFDVRDNVNSGSYQDYYEVRLSTTGNAIDDFTVVLSEMASPSASWTEFSYDLSSYAGQQGYIAIHHQASSAYWIMIDNFRIFTMVPAGDWNYSANNPIEALTTDIEGLDDDTDYEWQVQATCALDTVNDWSPLSAIFHTPSVCTVPVADSAINITYNSADLYWTGYQDEYNVRYRVYEIDSVTLYDNFNDGNANGWSRNDGDVYHWTGDYSNYFILLGEGVTTTQYLISPELSEYPEGSMVQFWHAGLDETEAVTFQVGYSSTTTALDAFTWGVEVTALIQYYDLFEEEIPAGTKYIAVKSTSPTEDACLLIDEFAVYNVLVPMGEWQYANNVTSPATITGLEDDTWYEWQVQGNLEGCGDDNATEWSVSGYFQTEEQTTYTQRIELTEGYNWVSFYVEGDPIEMLAALQTSLNDHGMTIEGPGGVNYNLGDGYWWGDLDEIGITNDVMYLIQVDEDCTIVFEGSPCDPSTTGITIGYGYNWISFPYSEEVDVNDALEGFEAGDEDAIEGPDGVLYYLGDGYWWGDFDTFVPGQGYLYYYSGDETQTLYFQTGARKVRSANLKPVLPNSQPLMKKTNTLKLNLINK